MAKRQPMTNGERAELIANISEVFSPSSPINKKDLFAGRLTQLQRIFDVVNTRGQHAAIFGERGVGKTSLANIVLEIAKSKQIHVVKINCDKTDKFSSVWRKALSEIKISITSDEATVGFVSTPLPLIANASEILPEDPSPNDIRLTTSSIGKSVIIFDEFDRLTKQDVLFADTIKTLSDSSVDSTIVIVGVAQNIDELIKEHASIDRALVQILMPRMDIDELGEILTKAMDTLKMQMVDEAKNLIVSLSLGLPHYTHVLGKASTLQAVSNNRWEITLNDVNESIEKAIRDTQQSIQQSYQEATTSPRKDTLFKEVLLACALSPVDSLGFFASADVREPLSKIKGKRYEIPNFSQHLDKFSSSSRGNILQKVGKTRRFRFRFTNPLLQPFVIMCGIADKMLTENILDLLKQKSSSKKDGYLFQP